MKKILVITYYWPPSGGAGVQRWLKFVKYLPQFGIEPHVLTVDPRYGSYTQIDKSFEKELHKGIKVYRTKSFEIFQLYKFLNKKKELPYGGFANEGEPSFFQKVFRFIRGNFFIPDPRKGWNRFAYKKAKQIIREQGIETIVTTSPPHSTQLIGKKLKRKLGLHWVADLRDPWTDIYYYDQLSLTGLAKKLDAKLEKTVLKQADELITVGNSLKNKLVAKAKGVDRKIHVVTNGFDPADFRELKSSPDPERTVITYAGTISPIYDLSGIIAAISQLGDSIGSKIILRFIGKVNRETKQKLTKSLGKMVEFMGYLPHKEALGHLLGSDALLLVIPKVKGNEEILTGKVFEYFASKKPILCLGPEGGDIGLIIEQLCIGSSVSYDDVEGIKKFLINIDNFEMTESIRKFSRVELTKQLASILITYKNK